MKRQVSGRCLCRLGLVPLLVMAVTILSNVQGSQASSNDYEPGIDNVAAECPGGLYVTFTHTSYCLWNYDFGAQQNVNSVDVTAADNPITLIFTGATLTNTEIQNDESHLAYDGQKMSDGGDTEDGVDYASNAGGDTYFQFSAGGKKVPSSGYMTCSNNDLASIESAYGINSSDLPYYPSGSTTDPCDYHMRIYGPTYDSTVGYFTYADTHEDWNDVNPCGGTNIPCSYPRFYGWQEDAALYVKKLFVAHSGQTDPVTGTTLPTATFTSDWAWLDNTLGAHPSGSQYPDPTCNTPTVTEKDGTAGPSTGFQGHYWKHQTNGTSEPKYTLYCRQSNGYAGRLDLSY